MSIALGLHRFRSMNAVDHLIFLATPPALGLANLALFWGYIAPRLTPDGELVYAAFWASYGSPPLRALAGMVAAPGRVFVDILTSGFVRLVVLPTLFLSFIGWRWMLAMAPMVPYPSRRRARRAGPEQPLSTHGVRRTDTAPHCQARFMIRGTQERQCWSHPRWARTRLRSRTS